MSLRNKLISQVEEAIAELAAFETETLNIDGVEPTPLKQILEGAMWRGSLPVVLAAYKNKLAPAARFIGMDRKILREKVKKHGIRQIMQEAA